MATSTPCVQQLLQDLHGRRIDHPPVLSEPRGWRAHPILDRQQYLTALQAAATGVESHGLTLRDAAGAMQVTFIAKPAAKIAAPSPTPAPTCHQPDAQADCQPDPCRQRAPSRLRRPPTPKPSRRRPPSNSQPDAEADCQPDPEPHSDAC
jgi:hypothetical protein